MRVETLMLLTSSQKTLMLVVQGQHSENHCPGGRGWCGWFLIPGAVGSRFQLLESIKSSSFGGKVTKAISQREGM